MTKPIYHTLIFPGKVFMVNEHKNNDGIVVQKISNFPCFQKNDELYLPAFITDEMFESSVYLDIDWFDGEPLEPYKAVYYGF